MKIRFAIRDWFWLAVVVGLAAGWWIDRHSIDSWRTQKDISGNPVIVNQKTGEEV
jgi:hypothetical protein